MRVLVTGATGFIGKKLVDRLIELNHKVAIHVRNNSEFIHQNCVIFSGELYHLKSEIIGFNPQYVFHLAGSSKYPKFIEEEDDLWVSNVLYGNSILSIIKDIPNVIFVNFSTSLAYNKKSIDPFNLYALTKSNFIHSLEFYCKKTSVRVFNLILYTIYGPGDKNKRAINYLIESLDSKIQVSMSPGEQVLDFVHINDVIKLCELLLVNQPVEKFEDIHVGTGNGITLRQAAQILEKLSNKVANINFGAIPYRSDEKMVNVAPILNNRFWKSTIDIEKGLLSLF